MMKISTEQADNDQHTEQPTFQKLMEIKASRKQQLAIDRSVARAKYDAMSPEEKMVIDEKFRNMFVQLKSQFGRSCRFDFKPSTELQKCETKSGDCSKSQN